MFNGTSDTENEETDREYSEFKVLNGVDTKELFLFSRQSHLDSIMSGLKDPEINKRSTSAESSVRNSYFGCVDSEQKSKMSKKRIKDDADSPAKSDLDKESCKKSRKGLHKIFSYVQGGISGLFSSTKA